MILVTGKGKFPNMGTLVQECTLHGLGGEPLILGVIIAMEVGIIVKVFEIIKHIF